MEYFRDKYVLLTGGSSGIGLAAARILRQSGAHLILAARDEERLNSAREELASLPSEAELHTLSLDVGDPEAISRVAGDLPFQQPVNVLINNAGTVMPGHFLELPQSQFDDMMRVNFMGSVNLTRALLPKMVEGRGGHVAFVSSLAGLMGIFGYTAYSASKFAVRGFAEALRCELKPHQVRVSICYPADTDTPQHEFEQQHLPDETRAIAGNAKCMTAESVATALLKGMAANRFHIVPGASSRFADVMYRLFPGMVRSMFDSDVRKAKKHAHR